MGAAGKKMLPDAKTIVDKFLTRQEFKPDPLNSSVLFPFFAQHFTHQFFKTDLTKGPGFTWGNHGVDVSHIYGKNLAAENALRTFKDGKMKTQVINGEEWPPLVKDAPVDMRYSPSTPENQRFAIGHELFGLLPGLLMYSTIWLREHNRVCDVMRAEHPEWTDEQIFQTVKLILLGETIKIVIEDYVQHISNYNYKLKFKPEILFGQSHQYSNRITVEFNHLYHWHPLMPDFFNISGQIYTVKDHLFNTQVLVDHGINSFVESFSRQRAGQMTHHNHGKTTTHIALQTIEHGRKLRLQPLNQYRVLFNLPAYKSFEEMTGDKHLAAELEELYGDIDAMEFYVGLMLEKPRDNAMFGPTILEMGAPASVKGLMSNPICSPHYWKPSTFGGEKGFEIVNTATLKKLFCQNINGKCPLVSFKVPSEEETDNTNCGEKCKPSDEL